jgi:hypothetical protein
MDLRRLTARERAEVGAERLAQGPVLAARGQHADAAGRIGAPLVALSTLAGLERRGTITGRQRAAGDAFHNCFRRAGLDALRAAPLVRLGGPGGGWRDVPGCERARRTVADAIRALGGGGTLAASCAWHVLGLEWSVRAWAALATRANSHVATGVLIATVDGLAVFFGLTDGKDSI